MIQHDSPGSLTSLRILCIVDDVEISDSDKEEEGDASEDERPELTEDQLKLLYLVSRCGSPSFMAPNIPNRARMDVRYSHAAAAEADREEWIRKVSSTSPPHPLPTPQHDCETHKVLCGAAPNSNIALRIGRFRSLC